MDIDRRELLYCSDLRLTGRGAAWLARLLWEQEVESSNLSAPICNSLKYRLDRDKWAEVQAHERARDARQAAERELNEAEMQCRSLGVPVDVTPDTESTHGAQRRPRHNRMEGAM